MSAYHVLRLVHISCVVLTLLSFCLRFYWRQVSPERLQQWWVRRLPHGIDICLLASALTMAFLSDQYPFQQAWLTAKFFGLLAYIGLGSLALKRATTPSTQWGSWVAALCAFAFIVGAALRRSAWSWLA